MYEIMLRLKGALEKHYVGICIGVSANIITDRLPSFQYLSSLFSLRSSKTQVLKHIEIMLPNEEGIIDGSIRGVYHHERDKNITIIGGVQHQSTQDRFIVKKEILDRSQNKWIRISNNAWQNYHVDKKPFFMHEDRSFFSGHPLRGIQIPNTMFEWDRDKAKLANKEYHTPIESLFRAKFMQIYSPLWHQAETEENQGFNSPNKLHQQSKAMDQIDSQNQSNPSLSVAEESAFFPSSSATKQCQQSEPKQKARLVASHGCKEVVSNDTIFNPSIKLMDIVLFPMKWIEKQDILNWNTEFVSLPYI